MSYTKEQIEEYYNSIPFGVRRGIDSLIFKNIIERLINRDYNSLSNLPNLYTGRLIFDEYSDLPPTGVLNILYRVSKDPDKTKNGDYYWNGTNYVKEDSNLENKIESTNNISGVTGSAVYDFVKSSGLHSLTFINNFEDNYDQFGNFNGGVISLDNNRLKVVTSLTAQGCYVKPEFVPNNTDHYLIVDINLNDVTSVIFYQKWAVTVQEITESGRYLIPFTSDNSGSFPYPILRATTTGTFYINELSLLVVNENPMYTSNQEFQDLKSLLPKEVYDTDFTSMPSFISNFNGGTSSINTNRLEVVSSGGSQGVSITGLEDNTAYTFSFNIDLNGMPYVLLYSYWSKQIYKIESSGKHVVTFLNEQSGGLPNPVFALDQVGTFYLDSLKIELNVPWVSHTELDQIKSEIDFSDTESAFRDYGAGTTGESVAIGEEGVGSNARSTRMGHRTHQMAQSGTVFGCGAENTKTHGIAMGRGAVNHIDGDVSLGGVGNLTLHMGSSWAHRKRAAFAAISGGYYEDGESVNIKGVNSLDARPYYHPDDTGRVYNQYEETVDSDGQIYLSLRSYNQNNAFPALPLLKNTYWSNITHLFKGHTEYYPPNPNQIYTLPLSTWTSGYDGEVGRFVDYSGAQYIRISSTDNTIAPDVSSDYLDVSVNWNSSTSRIECDYFKIYNPATYNTGQMTVKWECVWISKIENNTNIPPNTRQSDANWECVHNPNVKHWLIHFDKGHEYDTRHDFNKDGGGINIDGGTGTGIGKGGPVRLRSHFSNLSEADGNKQGVLKELAVFDADPTKQTGMQLLITSTGELHDVELKDDGDKWILTVPKTSIN